MSEQLTSTSFTTTLDMDGGVWYIESYDIDTENLTLLTHEENND